MDPTGNYLLINGSLIDGYILSIAKNIKTGKEYTARILNRNNFFKSISFEYISNEFEILGSIKHPNIQEYIETIFDENQLIQIIENETNNIFINFNNLFPLPEYQVSNIFYFILIAVSYIHELNFVHLDIRAENIFIIDEKIKLGKFLLSKYTLEEELISGNYGTIEYQAPEIFLNSNFDGKKADIWACGILLLFLLTGKLFYHSNEELNLLILKNQLIPTYLSEESQDLLNILLNKNPSQRPKLDTLFHHRFFSIQL